MFCYLFLSGRCSYWLLQLVFLCSFQCIPQNLASAQSSMLASPLPPFLWNILAILCFGCMTLCIITNFLVLWSICFTSSPVYFKNCPKYVTKKFCPGVYSFDELCFGKFSCSSELLFSYFFFLLCLIVSAYNIFKYL